MAVEVTLDGGIKGAHSDAGYDFGRIAYLGRTQDELIFEEIDIVIDVAQTVVGDGERTGSGREDTPLFHQVDRSILQHFGVDIEVWNFRTLSEGAQNGIGS